MAFVACPMGLRFATLIPHIDPFSSIHFEHRTSANVSHTVQLLFLHSLFSGTMMLKWSAIFWDWGALQIVPASERRV